MVWVKKDELPELVADIPRQCGKLDAELTIIKSRMTGARQVPFRTVEQYDAWIGGMIEYIEAVQAQVSAMKKPLGS